MIAFYITGVSQFQDMFTTMLECAKRKKKIWICIFDCVSKKRQFYYYENDEVIDYVKSVFIQNNIAVPRIDFFRLNDENNFKKLYLELSPKTVFMQTTWQKYAQWYPVVNNSKIIHFTWSYDSISGIKRSPYRHNIILNIARYPDDVDKFAKNGINNLKYFGNFKLDQINYNSINNHKKIFETKKKICFIPERFVGNGTNRKNAIELTDRIIKSLKDNGFHVVWKKREKGYPFDQRSVISDLKNKPDLIIEKDLFFPTSMIECSIKANNVLFVGVTSGIIDMFSVKNKSRIIAYDYNKPFEKEFIDFVKTVGKNLNVNAEDVIVKDISLVENYIANQKIEPHDKGNNHFKVEKCAVALVDYLESQNIID